MHIRLSDRHAGKAAEAPVVPRPGLFCKLIGHNLTSAGAVSVKDFFHRKLVIALERHVLRTEGFGYGSFRHRNRLRVQGFRSTCTLENGHN